MTNSTCERILGVYFENKMTFNTHVTKLCKKGVAKIAHTSQGIKSHELQTTKDYYECICILTI